MKIKKIATTFLIGSLSLATLITTVNAEGPQDSSATITFEVPDGDSIPDVLDPTDPEENYTPTDPGDPEGQYTDEGGPLTLDFVSDIEFGEQTIDAAEQTYYSETLRPFIQVSDRRGNGEGWNVTAQLSDFSVGTEENSLPGAILTFDGGDVISTSTSGEPLPNDEIILNADGDTVNVVTASTNAGLGSWITRWFPSDVLPDEVPDGLNDNVSLVVPAGAATDGENTANITWTLTAGPVAEEENTD